MSDFSFKLWRGALLDKLSKMIVIVSKKSPQPILMHCGFFIRNQEVILRVTNLEVFLEVKIPLIEASFSTQEEERKIFLRAHLLIDILKKTKSEYITFSVINNYIHLGGDNSKFSFTNLAHEFPDLVQEPLVTGPRFEFKDDWVFLNLDNNAGGACFLEKISPESFRVVFFDRRRITFYDLQVLPSENAWSLPSVFLFNPKYFKELKKFFSVGENIQISYNSKYMVFEADIRVVFLQFAAQKIQIHQFLQIKQDCISGIFKVKDIIGSLERVLLISSPITRSIKMNFTANELEISSFDPTVGQCKDVMPNSSDIRGSLWINGDFLLEALKLLSNKEVILYYKNSLKPLIIEGSSTSILMPIKQN